MCPLLALTVFFAGKAHSVQYQCAHRLVVRSVAVEYQQRGQQVPCKVVYHKPPQAPNGLWKAQVQVGFCESRAESLFKGLNAAAGLATRSKKSWQPEPVQAYLIDRVRLRGSRSEGEQWRGSDSC
jgi:hypothetical protein